MRGGSGGRRTGHHRPVPLDAWTDRSCSAVNGSLPLYGPAGRLPSRPRPCRGGRSVPGICLSRHPGMAQGGPVGEGRPQLGQEKGSQGWPGRVESVIPTGRRDSTGHRPRGGAAARAILTCQVAKSIREIPPDFWVACAARMEPALRPRPGRLHALAKAGWAAPQWVPARGSRWCGVPACAPRREPESWAPTNPVGPARGAGLTPARAARARRPPARPSGRGPRRRRPRSDGRGTSGPPTPAGTRLRRRPARRPGAGRRTGRTGRLPQRATDPASKAHGSLPEGGGRAPGRGPRAPLTPRHRGPGRRT